MQILIAASMAAATVGGTLYVLSLLALKRYPSFKRSFTLGFLTALVCIVIALLLNKVMLSFCHGRCIFTDFSRFAVFHENTGSGGVIAA